MDRDTTDHIHTVFVSTGNDSIKESILDGPDPIFPKEKPKCEGKCPRLSVCPISSMLQSIEADPDRLSQTQKKSALWENKLFGESKESTTRNDSLARLYGCCYNDGSPGALAAVLHKLSLQDGNNLALHKRDDDRVFNIHSTSNVECYNPQFSLFRLNGVFANRESDNEEKLNIQDIFLKCLRGLVISPVKEREKWLDYANTLKKEINKWVKQADIDDCDKARFTIIISHDGEKLETPKKPAIILLITNEYKNLLLKELLHVHSKQVMDLHTKGNAKELKKMIDNLFIGEDKIGSLPINEDIVDRFDKEKNYIDNYHKELLAYIEDNNQDNIERNIRKKLNSDGKRLTKTCPVSIDRCPFKSKALYILTSCK